MGFAPSQEGLESLDFAEGMLEQAVYGGVEDASRVELVADGDLAPCGEDGAALVVELVAGLQAAEVGPRLVEASRHT